MITIKKKMTEMKEKIYPTLPTIRESPTAPDIELTEMGNDQGHTYRLKVGMATVSKITNRLTVQSFDRLTG